MSTQPAPGWHPDPFRRSEVRYWDGGAWTEHVATQGRAWTDPPVPTPNPAGWYADPFARHETRYWDGRSWTEHVASQGRSAVDPPTAAPPGTPPPAAAVAAPAVAPAVDRAAAAAAAVASSRLFTEPTLVVQQKVKPVGTTLGYSVLDDQGRPLADIRAVRRDLATTLADAARLGLPKGSHRYEFVDPDGVILLVLTSPYAGLRSRFTVSSADGVSRGSAEHIGANVTGMLGALTHDGLNLLADKLPHEATRRTASAAEAAAATYYDVFRVMDGDERIGTIKQAGYRSWDFWIEDISGGEIARITKTWAGWMKERFTKSDNYVISTTRHLEEPWRSIAVASALMIDVTLKQGDQVHGHGGSRRYE